LWLSGILAAVRAILRRQQDSVHARYKELGVCSGEETSYKKPGLTYAADNKGTVR